MKHKHSEGWREREVIDARAVAEILAVSVAGAYELISRGEVPGGVRVGRLVRVRVSVFAAWLDQAAQK